MLILNILVSKENLKNISSSDHQPGVVTPKIDLFKNLAFNFYGFIISVFDSIM